MVFTSIYIAWQKFRWKISSHIYIYILYVGKILVCWRKGKFEIYLFAKTGKFGRYIYIDIENFGLLEKGKI
ncbi:hypothetical protein AFK68_16695 [Hydrocoleum sp. CS-953]|nr:hypothetical protein AFK68_16695 [Hydrocoleum sp. CS-953]